MLWLFIGMINNGGADKRSIVQQETYKYIKCGMASNKNKKISVVNAIIVLFLINICDAAKGLRNLSLTIEPAWVKRGQSAQLYCSYQIDGPLYSVKWYRGNLEFYRYSPFENPPAKIFPYTGIKVDLSVSNATQVTLRNVGFNLSGNFTCEVTADAPSFYTAVATNILTVVELPHSQPTLWTENIKYDVGDMLRANCSTQPSKPGASIAFLLNNIPVGDSPTQLHATQDNLQWATRELFMQILPSHCQNGIIILRCTAEVGTIYAESTETILGTTRKDPVPERVTSPNSGMKLINTCTALTWTFITWNFVVNIRQHTPLPR